jgi:primosomal replication protein N
MRSTKMFSEIGINVFAVLLRRKSIKSSSNFKRFVLVKHTTKMSTEQSWYWERTAQKGENSSIELSTISLRLTWKASSDYN